MPQAIAVSVADELVAMLVTASATFSGGEILPVRSYADWELELPEASDLLIDVAPVTTEQKAELASRSKMGFDVPVDIAVRRRFGQENQDEFGRVALVEVDALMLLVEEILTAFAMQRMTNFQAASWQETKILVAPIREHLHKHKQFSGIVRLTFRAHKDL